MMVCDLNGFKQINDRLRPPGRQPDPAGNSRRPCGDSCREYDYVARMGGDEFVMVAPGLDSTVPLWKRLVAFA